VSGYLRRLHVGLPAANSFIGAWRPFHSPVGAGSCALPASQGLMFGEADIGFDPRVRDNAAHIIIENAIILRQPARDALDPETIRGLTSNVSKERLNLYNPLAALLFRFPKPERHP
jgi:hypothetical protein